MTGVATRRDPRISVNKLGEYMVAPPRRRRRIIKDQIEPQSFIVARYKDAEDAIRKFLLGGGVEDDIIYETIDRLERASAESDWESQNQALCVEALERFLDLADELELGERLVRAKNNSIPVRIEGVDISVRPDVIVRTGSRNGHDGVGAIKLCFSKTAPIGEEPGRYIATILQQHLDDLFPDYDARREVCQVVDVFHGAIYTAPRAYKRRVEDVAAACEEIARGWM